MRIYHVFLPYVRDTSREFHAKGAWEWFESSCLDIFGGFSCVGDARGEWMDHHGNVCRDVSRVYSLGISRDKESEFRHLLAAAKIEFEQRFIFIVEVGVAELI